MKIQFNEAQLSRPQQESLIKVLDVLQAENENELVVTPVEFPLKLKVKLDDDIEMLLGWDAEKESYAGLTTPERLEQDIKDLTQETVQPEPEPELAPVLEGIKTLARTLVANIKAMDSEQRQVFWAEFSSVVAKELL